MLDPHQLPLRNIHLPPPVGWWPPAPGWWLLLALGVLLTGVLFWLYRAHTNPSIKKTAFRELNRLQNNPSLTATERLRHLSVLLRRICLSAYPRTDIASLTGQAWLDFLDKPLNDHRFSLGPGNVLANAPYRHDAEADFGALFALCKDWIGALPRRPS